jgi:gas vesicle protein
MSDSENNEERSVLIYMLAGIGLGALIGAAAGLLFAPKAGTQMREDLGRQFAELKKKTSEWYDERKSKKDLPKGEAEEAG